MESLAKQAICGCYTSGQISIVKASSMSHPWFNPLYRRVLTLAFCLGWLVFELFLGEPLWLFLAAGASAYALWDFFLSGRYPMATGDDRGP